MLSRIIIQQCEMSAACLPGISNIESRFIGISMIQWNILSDNNIYTRYQVGLVYEGNYGHNDMNASYSKAESAKSQNTIGRMNAKLRETTYFFQLLCCLD